MEAPESYIDGHYNNAVDCLLDDTLCINEGLTSNDDSSNSSSSVGTLSYQSVAADSHFSGDLCVPYDELGELEWLSNFVEDSSFSFSFSSFQSTLHITSGSKPLPAPQSASHPESVTGYNMMFQPHDPLPGKPRPKRSRVAPGDWSVYSKKEKNPNPSVHSDLDSTVRTCLHCAAEKTPQWRTGPMGPKTLCNACGVRYKSGRLVPEYRPAASPTFVATKHSNSHRKVLELRRQKEMHRVQQQEQFLNQTSIFGVSNGGQEDFMIHHHNSVPN